MSELLRAKELANTEPDEAMRICNAIMNDDPDSEDSYLALFMTGYIMMQAERYGFAYHIFKRCAEIQPKQSEIYSNMGMCLEVADPDQSIRLFEKAFKLNPKNASSLANEGLMRLQKSQPEKCIELCNRALKIDPTLKSAVHNRGLAKLMLRDHSGWKDYNDTLGVKHREKRDYGLKEWNGEEGTTVIVYGEQGVGDEIMFASCLEDIARHNNIILDCDARLESVFRRSLPEIEIHGTRFKAESPIMDSKKAQYQCAIGQLPYFFRKSDNDYPGKPYLIADEDRVKQWDCLLSKDKPRIGFAWRGGTKSTGKKKRSACITDFEALFKLDAEFVCLDYLDLDKAEQDYLNFHGVKHWPRAVRKGCDLEETFALVRNLDFVVTVCTAMVYIAGSMGVPTFVLVPKEPGYRYHSTGDSFLWYNDTKLLRGDFQTCIESSLGLIKKRLSLITRSAIAS